MNDQNGLPEGQLVTIMYHRMPAVQCRAGIPGILTQNLTQDVFAKKLSRDYAPNSGDQVGVVSCLQLLDAVREMHP